VKWNYTIETETGDEMTGVLIFVEKEEKLTGEVNSDDGGIFPMTKVEIKEENTLYSELKPEYDVLKITLEVKDKKFKGNGSTYEGEFTLFGEKTE
jgi:hypothetical protein